MAFIQKEYNPEVEFEYLDADVWIETDAAGNQDVAYTQDVLETFLGILILLSKPQTEK